MVAATGDTITPTLLEAGDIRIAAYGLTDAADLLAAVSESLTSVGRWLPWCHAGYGESDARDWIEHCQQAWQSGDEFAFAVRDRGTREFLGGVGLNQCNRQHRSANLGYWVRQSRQGGGVAVSSARLAIRFGLEQLGLKRIEIVSQPGNTASRRVAEKLGATFEGLVPNHLQIHGKPVDAMIYALHPPDGAA